MQRPYIFWNGRKQTITGVYSDQNVRCTTTYVRLESGYVYMTSSVEIQKIEKQVDKCLTLLKTEFNSNDKLDQKMDKLVTACEEVKDSLPPNFKRKNFQNKKLIINKNENENESIYERMKSKHKKIDQCIEIMGIKEKTFEQKLNELLRDSFTRRQERKKQKGEETKEFDPKYSDSIVEKMQRCLFHLDVNNAYDNNDEEYNLEKILEA
ncbi:6768_t:CDS:2, partial [Ambispora leptoticha]